MTRPSSIPFSIAVSDGKIKVKNTNGCFVKKILGGKLASVIAYTPGKKKKFCGFFKTPNCFSIFQKTGVRYSGFRAGSDNFFKMNKIGLFFRRNFYNTFFKLERRRVINQIAHRLRSPPKLFSRPFFQFASKAPGQVRGCKPIQSVWFPPLGYFRKPRHV